MSFLLPPSFPNFITPDLGCLVRRKHELQIEEDNRNIHVEFVPSLDFAPRFHQTYFRIKCGEARFFERCMVHRTTDFSIPGPILENFPPDFILGGDQHVHATDWLRYPVSTSPMNYWYFGQYRNPAETQWKSDVLVGHSYDIYENGTLSTVHYDDTGADRDLNDMVIEIAIVGRTPMKMFTQAVDQAVATRHFEEHAAPHILAEMAKLKTQ